MGEVLFAQEGSLTQVVFHARSSYMVHVVVVVDIWGLKCRSGATCLGYLCLISTREGKMYIKLLFQYSCRERADGITLGNVT